MRASLTPLLATLVSVLAGPACSKKDDGPPKMTKEVLDQLQANSRGNTTPLPNNGQPVASRENGLALPGIGLPPEAAVRSLAIDAPVPLLPAKDSQDANPTATYTLGDDIRFLVRIGGFTLHEGNADFDFDWTITDTNGLKIVGDHKRVQRPFKPEGAYVAIITHHPVALGGGSYIIHAKATDNLASYLSREGTANISYGAPSLKPSNTLQIRAVQFAPHAVANQTTSFDFVLVGLLVDATNAVNASVDVTLHPTSTSAPDRVLPTQKVIGKATADGAFPVTVSLEGLPTGTYQVTIHATDNTTKRETVDTETMIVQGKAPETKEK